MSYKPARNPLVTTAVTFTRPNDTTAYSYGDLVANSTTAGSVVPMTIVAARGVDVHSTVRGGSLQTSRGTGTGVTLNALFAVHLFNVLPVMTVGDNSGGSSSGLILPKDGYIGEWQVALNRIVTNGGAFGQLSPIYGSSIKDFAPASGTRNIYALIEALAPYAPGAQETFTLKLDIE